MITERLKKLLQLAKEEFSDILGDEPQIIETKLRLYLKDGSFIDIRYPLEKDYSFHWQRKKKEIRINTAPDHKEIKSFPRHLHIGSGVKEDRLTNLSFSPEENLRRFLKFVRDEFKKQKWLVI